MRFYQTQTFKHLQDFTHVAEVENYQSRTFLDLLMLHKLISLSSVKNILEIGYYEGLTFGVLYEASGDDARLTSCDISYHRDKLKNFLPFTKSVAFSECRSDKLTTSDKFDFICLDGDHSYESTSKDLAMLDTWADTNCVVLVDGYEMDGVKQALSEFITNESKFMPILLGIAQVFLVKKDNHTFFPLIDQAKTDLFCISSWSIVTWNTWQIYHYQYTHDKFITALKDIIIPLDL